MKGVQFIEGLPDRDKMTVDMKHLVVVDNLMADTEDRMSKRFTKGSHHCDNSIMYIVQSLFGKKRNRA